MKITRNVIIAIVLSVFGLNFSLATKRVVDDEWPTSSSLRLLSAHNSPGSSPKKTKKEEVEFSRIVNEEGETESLPLKGFLLKDVDLVDQLSKEDPNVKNLDWGRTYKASKFLPLPDQASGARRRINF